MKKQLIEIKDSLWKKYEYYCQPCKAQPLIDAGFLVERAYQHGLPEPLKYYVLTEAGKAKARKYEIEEIKRRNLKV